MVSDSSAPNQRQGPEFELAGTAKMRKKGNSLSAMAALVGLIVFSHVSPATAQTSSYSLTQDLCSSSCGAGPYGDVTVKTLSSNEVSVDVTLAPNYVFAKSAGDFLLFNLSGNASDYLVTTSNSNFSPVTGSSVKAPPSTGGWNFGIDCTTCKGGTSPPTYTALSFDVTANGISPSNFISNGSGLYFGADVGQVDPSTGNVVSTGLVGANSVMSAPEMDPFSAAGGLTLLFGALTVLRGGRSRSAAKCAVA